MNKISQSLKEIYGIDTLANRDQWMNRLHPLVKFVLTIVFILLVVSFQQYDVIGLMGMSVYLLISFQLAELSFLDCLRRLKMILPLIILVGLTNLFLDRIVIQVGMIQITTGFLSMLTLIMKGSFSVFASYLLIATTTIDDLCDAMRTLHFPSIIITQFMLTYRYITVLLNEVDRLMQAYALRAPKQKGIQFRVWGSLTGQLLLRSIQRANDVYESMVLRGFSSSFQYVRRHQPMQKRDWVYFLLWLTFFLFAKKVPFILWIGQLF